MIVTLHNADGEAREFPEAWAKSFARMMRDLEAIVVTNHDKELEDEVEQWLWQCHLERCKPESQDAFWIAFCTDGSLDLTWNPTPWTVEELEELGA